MALGRHLQTIGGMDNLKAALEIFTRLRTRAAGGVANTACDDKEIELGIAAIFLDMGAWGSFDNLQLEKRLFSGFETSLFFSVRNFRELTQVETILPEHAVLLGQALHWAALAVEKSEGTSASCITQLSHCYRLLSVWPKSMLKALDIKENKQHEFKQKEESLFALARNLEPYRNKLKKNEPWRQREQQLLKRMTTSPH
ncbi:hypothetical protein E1189_02775 [Sansalvadorimonas verongulae]|nr:hypothetical protein [Sansalvadorimonas verongulae]